MGEVKIYSSSWCPYCIRAKMLLKKLKINFEEIIVKSSQDMDELIKKTGMRTVPQIFINDKLVGGCDELYELHSNGGLTNLLK